MSIRDSLTNQTMDKDQENRVESIREHAIELGEVLVDFCKTSREKSLALTKLEECVMWAVKSIVFEK